MPSRDYDSVLFDLDGVLVDSRAAISGCINHAVLEHNFSARPAEDLHEFIGSPLANGFASLTGHPEASPMVASCVESYRARYVDASLQETTVVPGIDLALTELAGRYLLAVATSKPLTFAEPLLTALHLRDFFEAVAGPDLSVQGENKASTIAAALKMIGNPKRAQLLGAGEEIDSLLESLVSLKPAELDLSPFEQLLLGTAQEDLSLPAAPPKS